MFIAERQTKILEMIQKEGSVQVESLAKDLEVSPMTIRRDLRRLKEEGVIERCHGGAVLKQEITYADKQVSNKEIKEQIAAKSVERIKDNYVVFLDAGTTTYEIAKRITSLQGILVVTNDLEIAQFLKNTDVELMVCGGVVQKSTGSMYGYYATQMMETLQFDVGFFGAASIDSQYQILTPTIDKVFLKKLLLKNCKESYLVVDDSKFYRKALNKVADLKDYSGIITNHKFRANDMVMFQKSGLEIIRI